jgi:endonuclease-3
MPTFHLEASTTDLDRDALGSDPAVDPGMPAVGLTGYPAPDLGPAAARAAGREPAARAPRRAAARGRRRRAPDPASAWAKRLGRTRPGLVEFVLDALAAAYGRPVWERRLDPTSELILTILSQNSADLNAERAFESLRRAFPSTATPQRHHAGPGWGGAGLSEAPPPDWGRVEAAPLPELVAAIRPGGLGQQKAPRIQAALRAIRETHGDHSLEFLGELPPLEARAWLTRISGVGKKTASVLLMFCFNMPLMAVDRHVERVAHRIGLIPPRTTADDAHDLFLAMLRPDQVLESHVNLIRHGRLTCHARRPACASCPVRPRCRYVDPKAP